MEWQPDSTQNFTYSRLQEVKLKLLPKTPQKGGISLYPVHFICCLPAARCGWPFPLLSTLVSCIQPVVYEHHGVFSAQLSSTLLSCSSHWYLPQMQVFALAFIQTGCLPGEVLALIPSLQRELPLCSLQLGAVCALLKARSVLSARLVMKRQNNIWFQCWPWEMLLVAGLPVKLQVVELSLNQMMTLSRFSNPFLDFLQNYMFIPMLMWWELSRNSYSMWMLKTEN